ncbi:MAG: lasso peptide biosynthesis B2 protein [Gemmatimonadota bacterium]
MSLSPLWKLRAVCSVAVMPPLLEYVPFASLGRYLTRNAGKWGDARLDDQQLARWVDALLSRLPGLWRRTCLRRSAVLYAMLHRAGRPVTLRIGVRRDDPSAVIQAHAWLELDGAPYLEAAGDPVPAHQIIATLPA